MAARKTKARRRKVEAAAPAVEREPEPEAPPAPDPRWSKLRLVAATLDAALERLARLDAEAARHARIGRLSPLDVAAWERSVYDPAKAAADEAWGRLGELLAEAGYSALVAGGRLYFRNAGRSRELGMEAMSEDVHRIAGSVVRSEFVLDLDRDAGDAPTYRHEWPSVAWMAEGIGWPEVMDRLFWSGRYEWIREAVQRFGADALDAGRLRAVLADDAPAPR